MNENINTQTTDTTIDSQNTDATQMPQLPPPPMFGQAPTFNGTQPTFDATQQPTFDATQQPTFDGTQPTFDGTQPTFDGTQPTFDGTQPTFDGTQPTFNAGQMPPPPMFGQGFMPQADMNMWGNSAFLGEQMLNGENFTAPADLGEITDANTDISVNFGEQNAFGFPPAGMPSVMDGGQIVDQSTSTDTQAE